MCVRASGDTLAKPKHHTLIHLMKYLDLYGPFRQMWCMPFEMFLQLLKKYCEMSNFQTVPYSVLRKWALSRALKQSGPGAQTSSMLEIESKLGQINRSLPLLISLLNLSCAAVVPTCELFSGPDLRSAQLRSSLFAFALQKTLDHALVDAARHASRIATGPQTVASPARC